jgi:antitoxin (DNA-binding transcriptional repressor) of toxin-antitoxin stability system
MARYSIATTKDKLSSLIDKALAGEEVIITRHGKPVVELNVVGDAKPIPQSRTEAFARLRQFQKSLPLMSTSYLELKRMDEAEGAL